MARRSTISASSVGPSFGSPHTWQRNPCSANSCENVIPDFASRSELATSSVLLPIGDTIPMPVTTTRLIAGSRW